MDFNDPITLQVLWNRLVFITDQADLALGRTAFSPIVRENHDFVTVLMDADGNALAQCTLAIPVFISTLPLAVKEHFLKAHPPHTLKPGDVLATNNARIGTGHPPDLVMVTPVFHAGAIVAYAGCIAHLPDVGGRPQSPDSVDVFEEGIRLPILKFFREGVANQDVFDIIASSSRLPEEVLGDINSMVAANEVMRREVVAFLAEYKAWPAWATWRRPSTTARRRICARRSGPCRTASIRAEMVLDGIDADIVLKAAVHVEDDSIHVDYAGTSAQVEYGINVAPHYRIAHSLYALKCLLDPGSPNNEGCAIPCTDAAPEGSILNPRATAAGAARNLVGHTIPSLIFRALAEVLPDRVQADSGGAPIWGINCTGTRGDGTPYSSIQNFPRRPGRARGVRRQRHAVLPVQLQGHAGRDLRALRPRGDRAQGAGGQLRRRRAVPRRPGAARHDPQHLRRADEHLPQHRTRAAPLLRRAGRQGRGAGPGGAGQRPRAHQGPRGAGRPPGAGDRDARRRRLGRPGEDATGR